MRQSLWAGVLAAVLVPGPAGASDREAINRAIDSGVTALRKLQKTDGSWEFANEHSTTGATSLAALTLLECGAEKDDPAVVAAAKYVRTQCVRLRWTYSISLVILFLDRLGDPADEPLIESLAARLVAGQRPTGVWAYQCPDPATADQQLGELPPSDGSEIPGTKGRPRRELTESDRKKLNFVRRVGLLRQQGTASGVVGGGDNSNTQFATLALWVCRRHGLPVEPALGAIAYHFRTTQGSNGEWMYDDAGVHGGFSATMTCAGLLGLAVGDGLINAKVKDATGGGDGERDPDRGKGGADDGKKPKGKSGVDVSEDRGLRAGLRALAVTVGKPLEQLPASPPEQGGVRIRQSVGGRSFFLLWSVERVAVLLDLDTIGGKDWYDWGASILLANQDAKGLWEGSYWQGGVDTSFALLFLKKANLLGDLTKLTGRMKDPGQRVLRSGGVGGEALGPVSKGGGEGGAGETPGRVPGGPALGDSPGAKLALALVGMPPGEQGAEIDRLRDKKGADNTEALATAIPYLEPEPRRKAREALATRESRMKVETIGRDLGDENPEIRRAAAVACILKETKDRETRQFIPRLIDLLSDPYAVVSRAAYASLKELSGEDFGPPASASDAEREQAAERWRAWWGKQPR